MKETQVAYQLRVLFDKKITSFYMDSFKGMFGKVQVEVLDYLYENREARTKELAERLNVPKQHVSKIISRLEELELVANKPDISDGRASLYFLTDKGMDLMNSHIEQSNRNFEALLQNLCEEERKQLLGAMELMVTCLNKM